MIRLFKSSEPDRFGNGDQCRDFIYVKDAVRMTCGYLENTLSGIFNIGSGQTTTWNQLANALFKAVDKPAKIDYIDMPGEMVGQYQNFTCAQMDKYKHKLGLSPADKACQYSIEEGVSDYLRNYLLKDERW